MSTNSVITESCSFLRFRSINLFDSMILYLSFRNDFKEEKILDIVERIQGPWAFVLWDKLRNQIWFGRDFFGRQSLLLHTTRHVLCVFSFNLAFLLLLFCPRII